MTQTQPLQTYTCPNCSRAVYFDSESQRLHCPYCDAELSLDSMAFYHEAMKEGSQEGKMRWESASTHNWSQEEAGAMRQYSCQSCGGEILTSEHTIATSCPFCDNPVVLTENVQGDQKPDFVIPFKISKEEAKAALEAFLTDKFLLPKVFKEESHLDEMKALYVPFWLFDAKAQIDGHYTTQEIREWSDFDYVYTQVTYYLEIRKGNMQFEHLAVDGSSSLADDLMQSIEPFDFTEAVPFQSAYLAGYLADKYDVEADESQEVANQRIQETAKEQLRQTVYQASSIESEQVSLEEGTYHYALYPVWLLTTTWQGQRYLFAMNGQTGKFVGDLPVDKQVYRRTFALLATLVALVLMLLYSLIGLFGLGGGF
ncbi:hypothetical protein [Streptococcus sp. DD13]|uniref:hypothetical protein n=1 Tax=Streptococcus sp. DD13 TaxID=1777881 RepID=UPI000794E8AE|nr:hypothetical protein [Streptococcus sp. DD13]KXT77579.1 Primosomal protein N' (replication factor Y) - superfamily II helicase [Streptococcus sp. DD13]